MRQGTMLEVGDLKVERDQYCYVVQRRRKVQKGKHAGEDRWINIGYYGTLPGLAKRLLQEEVGLRLDVELMKYGAELDSAVDRLAAAWGQK